MVRRDLGITPSSRGGYKFDLRDPVFVDSISTQVYTRLVEQGDEALAKGESVIFDAAFNFYRQRVPIYQLADKHGLGVHAIRCSCPDDAEVRRRLDLRAQRPEDVFNEAWQYATYESTRAFAEDLSLDWEKPLGPSSILDHDSLRNVLTVAVQRGSIPSELFVLTRHTMSQRPLDSVRGG
jgi:predicted kinase